MANKEKIIQLYENYMNSRFERTDTYKNITKKIINAEDSFFRGLTEEQITEYEQIRDLETQRHNEISKNIFIDIFSLKTGLNIEELIENTTENQ